MAHGQWPHLQVDDRNVVPVRPPHDGVEVLQLGGQEGSEGSLQADGARLLEAQVVGAADPPHVARLGGVEGDEVELERKEAKTQPDISYMLADGHDEGGTKAQGDHTGH